MEIVVIKKAVKKEHEGKPYLSIELEDGRKGTSRDLPLENFVGKIIELEIKLGKMYDNTQYHFFNLPNQKQESGGQKKWAGKQRDFTLEKKMAALNNAVTLCQNRNECYAKEVLLLADTFFEWLDKR